MSYKKCEYADCTNTCCTRPVSIYCGTHFRLINGSNVDRKRSITSKKERTDILYNKKYQLKPKVNVK